MKMMRVSMFMPWCLLGSLVNCGSSPSSPKPASPKPAPKTETALVSKKWEYASWFNRLKQRIGAEWNPDELEADLAVMSLGPGPFVTTTTITVSREGELIDATVKTSSSIPALDEDARQAIEHAAPFGPLPPKLADESTGHYVFDFEFHYDRNTQESRLQRVPAS